MTSDVAREQHGDRPLDPAGEDRLGFRPMARELAESIVHYSANTGFVIGVEGAWGSGKSSLVNLIAYEVEKNPEAFTVRFAPWLVGSREALLRSLFEELALAISNVEGKDLSEKASSASSLLREYSRRASGFSGLAKLAGMAGVPFAGSIGDFLKTLGDAVGTEPTVSLYDLKLQIEQKLAAFSKKIVVIIDDLDRLEPIEALEVLRLVKAVADFPSIVYVICYDAAVIADAVERQLSIQNGAEYLKKIVQLSFQVPEPEPFDLRQWLLSELERITTPERRDERERLAEVIDLDAGHLLVTPRDVARTLNAVSLYWHPIRKDADFADAVWFQLIRVNRPDLYKWIERYVPEMTERALGASISAGKAEEMQARLEKLVDVRGKQEREWVRRSFSRILPGFSYRMSENYLFQDVSRDQLVEAIRYRRLKSPEHSRFYFAFAKPAGAIGADQLQIFLDAASSDPAKATQYLKTLATERRAQGGTKADILVDRLFDLNDELADKSATGIIVALGSSMDDVASVSEAGMWGDRVIWSRAKRLLRQLLERLQPKERSKVLKVLFSGGTSLGWLTEVFRDQTFAHGVFGDRPEPVEDRMLSKSEFNLVRKTMLARYEATEDEVLLQTPQLLSLLHGWGQAGGYEVPSARLAKMMATDAGMVQTLDTLRKWTSTNGKVWCRLSSSELENLLDVAAVKERLTALTKVQGDVGIKAKELRDVWNRD